MAIRIRRRWRSCAALLLALSAVVALGALAVGTAGAKPAKNGASLRKLTLMLDFIPSPYHIGIYQAVKSGYYKQKNIDLKIIQPTSAGDYARLVSAGKADIGMADAVDLLTFVGKGTKYRGFLAALQRPLAGLAVLRSSKITSPGQLVGKKVASPGSPSNKAFLFAMVKHAGGDPNKVKLVTTGFDFAKYLVAGRIDGFTGYWTDAIEAEVSSHVPLRFMRIDKFGGPRYPSLLFYATQDTIAKNPSLIRDFAAATAHGYNDMVRAPNKAIAAFLSQNRSVKAAPTQKALKTILPLFKAGTSRYGHINTGDLTKLSRFLVKYKVFTKAVPASKAITNQFVP